MSEIAIRAEHLAKRYRIGGKRERYRTLRDTLADVARVPGRLARAAVGRARGLSGGDQEFWALKDISFEIGRGEVVGVIGANGAGKSTLLKVLSRITDPTDGWADVRGRVGSLLEVGTGFHPELTGRENIYLNGAILGMRRAEIEERFDEIVAFAEVERFLETPVKHYSSGMYLRLAFSVAAHLEPEILLVDEVLAVGDAAFQKKCMGKMEDVATTGRTVLFVSHNLGAIKELCQSALVLRAGELDFRGPVVQGVARYMELVGSAANEAATSQRGTRFARMRINGADCSGPITVRNPDGFSLDAQLIVERPLPTPRFKCIVEDAAGTSVVYAMPDFRDLDCDELPVGVHRVRVDFPTLWLSPGIYTLVLKAAGGGATGRTLRLQSERVMLDVTGPLNNGKHPALLAPALDWRVAPESAGA